MTRSLEVAVIGAGPGGLSAALAARAAGAGVTVFDAYARPGGQYFRQPPDRVGEGATARQRQGRALWSQAQAAGVEIRSNALVWNASSDRTLFVAAPGGTQTFQAEAVIVAAGAYERPAVFPGWTLPGVITSGAVQTLLAQRVRPGRRALVVGTGPLQLVTAAELLHAGVEVSAVLEGSSVLGRALRHGGGLWGQWERLREGAASYLTLVRHGTPYRIGWGIVAARGRDGVEGATIARLDADWRPIPGSEREIACDTVCMGYGLIPFAALLSLMGAKIEWRFDLGGEAPVRDARFETTVAGVYAVGDGAGVGGARMAMLEGQVAGLAAASGLGHGRDRLDAAMRRAEPDFARERAFQRTYSALFTPGPGIFELADDDTLICRCEGVTLRSLRQAAAGGATTFAEAKAVTRCGMGECQGRMCGQQTAHLLAQASGRPIAEVGQNHPRPPVFPLPLGALRPHPGEGS